MLTENEKAAPPLKVLLIDDHRMVRDGLKIMLLSFKKQLQFHIDEAENGEQALKKINKANYDLIIIDYQMPGLSGAETILRILRFKPDMKILALSNYDEVPYVQSMLDAGAKGYVLKNIDSPQMLCAIKTVLDNKNYYSNEVAIKLLEGVKKEKITNLWSIKELTKREVEILKLIVMEMTNEEIAAKLFISKRTVDSHRQNLMDKLHVKNTAGLVKAAYKLKLLSN